MRFRHVIPVALAVAAALGAAPLVGAANPISVPANAGWVSTGLTVATGQRLDVSAEGSVHTAPIPDFHIPGEFKSASGPAGQTSGPTCGEVTATFSKDLLAITGPCALDSAYFGELIGRVGNRTFRIGDATTIVSPGRGTLELAVNDLTLTLFDNTGAFTVVVR
jgi:hypothetical protein